MKIHSIRLRGFQQYKNTFIDFTNPETGQPADKICIIGKNGTGKSTLMNVLVAILNNINSGHSFGLQKRRIDEFFCSIALKFDFENDLYFYCSIGDQNPIHLLLDAKVEQEYPDWFDKLSILTTFSDRDFIADLSAFRKFDIRNDESGKALPIVLKHSHTDLLIHSPAESIQNSHLGIGDVPITNLNEALSLFNDFPFYHNITNETVTEFWKIMIFLIKKRENEREQFENEKENLNKTKSQLIAEFEKINPKILNKIADLWNTILEKAGLEFDVEKADNPIQLNDNLKAYIVLRNTKERISYNNLSTGIRNFIFRIGHIFSLYFNREIKRGFVFIDEPENSLFPDFLFDLVSIYQKILIDKNGENNSQLFMSTHNPIIAAQFEPYERVVLDWDENGYVRTFKGFAPVGDDPNDILLKDFKLTHVMGKKGQEFWEHYLELKKKLRRTTDDNEKELLVKEISEIGTKYNFE